MSQTHGMGPIVLTPAEGDSVARAEVQRARGDLHHLISPIIGSLRRAAAYDEQLSVEEMNWMTARLQHALDVADALCGERPMRDRLAELQAQIAADAAQG